MFVSLASVLRENIWMILWSMTLVTLANQNDTRVQRKKILWKKKKKDSC